MKYIVFALILGINFCCSLSADETETNDDESGLVTFNEDSAYCFRFTWLGPKFENSSKEFNTYNSTCEETLDSKRGQGVPCRQPLVLTYDGTQPNIKYMWDNFKERVICRQSKGQICAKYTYTYANAVQNATYMCTKATEVGGGPISSGCYETETNGVTVRACVCKSSRNNYPCNGSSKNNMSSVLLGTSFVILTAILLKIT